MFKNSKLKWIGGLLLIPIMLVGCEKSNLPIEAPELVLKKSLNYPMEAYQADVVMNLDVLDKSSKQSGEITMSMSEQGSMTGEAIVAEVLLKMDADLKLTGPNNENPKSMLVNAEGKFTVNGEDIFAQLNKLSIEGEHPEVESAQAFLPLLGPYLNDVFYLNPTKAAELNSQLSGAQATPNITAFSQKELVELREKMAELEVLKVTKENGIKKITTSSGEKIPAYHYDIEFQPEKFDELLNLISQGEMVIDEEQSQIINGVIEKFNEKMTFEMWIGQEDYFPYKTNISVDTFTAEDVVSYMMETEGIELGEEESSELKNIQIDLSATINNVPLEKVDIDVPNKEETVDLIEMLEGLVGGFMGGNQALGLPTGDIQSMTDEEMEALMEGFSEEELDAMMEGLSTE